MHKLKAWIGTKRRTSSSIEDDKDQVNMFGFGSERINLKGHFSGVQRTEAELEGN